MEALIRKLDGVRLRRIEVEAWESPVAVENGIRSLPTLWLYDGHDRVSTDARDVLQRLVQRAQRN